MFRKFIWLYVGSLEFYALILATVPKFYETLQSTYLLNSDFYFISSGQKSYAMYMRLNSHLFFTLAKKMFMEVLHLLSLMASGLFKSF